jgi:hypothetical protein
VKSSIIRSDLKIAALVTGQGRRRRGTGCPCRSWWGLIIEGGGTTSSKY